MLHTNHNMPCKKQLRVNSMFYLFAIACLALDGSRRDLSSWSVPSNAERLALSFDSNEPVVNSEAVQADLSAHEVQNTGSRDAVGQNTESPRGSLCVPTGS